MKKLTFNTCLLTWALLAGILFFTAGCSNNDDDNQPKSSTMKVTVQLTGASEVPPVPNAGTGTIDITYDSVTNIINYNVEWQLGATSATTTGMHFHGSDNGSPTTNSPVLIPVEGFSAGSSGTLTGSTPALTPVQESQLLSGKWYFNIHSSNYPSGAMRGNIVFSTTASSTNNGSNPSY